MSCFLGAGVAKAARGPCCSLAGAVGEVGEMVGGGWLLSWWWWCDGSGGRAGRAGGLGCCSLPPPASRGSLWSKELSGSLAASAGAPAGVTAPLVFRRSPVSSALPRRGGLGELCPSRPGRAAPARSIGRAAARRQPAKKQERAQKGRRRPLEPTREILGAADGRGEERTGEQGAG